MITKVISGGQVGADLAGLRAAEAAGIPTGGYAPDGFKTQHGPNLDLRDRYGLVDCGKGYAYRTELNVQHSDGTIRFAVNFNSPGERCTWKALLKHHKPYFDVAFTWHPGLPGGWEIDPEASPHWAKVWIADHNIKVLNVAGNAKTELEPLVERYLAEIFG